MDLSLTLHNPCLQDTGAVQAEGEGATKHGSLQGGEPRQRWLHDAELPQPLSFSGRASTRCSPHPSRSEGREEPAATPCMQGLSAPFTIQKLVGLQENHSRETRAKARPRQGHRRVLQGPCGTNAPYTVLGHRKEGELPVLLMKQVQY